MYSYYTAAGKKTSIPYGPGTLSKGHMEQEDSMQAIVKSMSKFSRLGLQSTSKH